MYEHTRPMREKPLAEKPPMIVINSVAGRIAKGALPNEAMPFVFLVNERILKI